MKGERQRERKKREKENGVDDFLFFLTLRPFGCFVVCVWLRVCGSMSVCVRVCFGGLLVCVP